MEARLATRRVALGLPSEPLAFADAMKQVQEEGYEGLLARVGSKRLRPDEVLDAALDLENLLSRADAETAEARPPDPPLFDARLADARGKATALARAVARGNSGDLEAKDLLASCVDCHVTFRIPR